MAPKITRSVLDGSQPISLTTATLIRDTRLSIDWSQQKAQLGFTKS
jgi:hypothetical protein